MYKHGIILFFCTNSLMHIPLNPYIIIISKMDQTSVPHKHVLAVNTPDSKGLKILFRDSFITGKFCEHNNL